tara:strand:+ start:1170 stop:1568 length:399 start_codon:yes stop_codon:yes gene_type:complete
MGGMSRRKGAAFEREVAGMIRDHLGYECKRNLMQTADGGHDLLGIPGWAVECKRYAKITPYDLKKFWEQTVSQAIKVSAWPCLITKEDRKPVQVHINWIGPGSDCYGDYDIEGVATISFDLWCGIVRETIED